jgi:hypothetical protein
VPSLQDGSLKVFDVDGASQRVIEAVGDSASSSADGSTSVLWFESTDQPISVLRSAGRRTIDVPGQVQPPDPQLSPDGSGLVLVCAAPDGGLEALLLSQ